MGVLELGRQAGSQLVHCVGGKSGEPGKQKQRGGAKRWVLGRAVFVVGRRSGVDEGIVKEDAMSLLVVLPLPKALHQLITGRPIVANDPERVPAVLVGSPSALLSN